MVGETCCSCDQVREIVKEVVKEEVKRLFDEEVIKLKTQATTRKKRAPSEYNIFIGKCMKGDGKSHHPQICRSKYDPTEPWSFQKKTSQL